MAAAWPGSLPQDPAIGYTVTPVPNVIESAVGYGPTKRRRRSTGQRSVHATPIDLNGTQKDVLDTFFWDTLEAGTLPFTWKAFDTGDAATFRFMSTPQLSNVTPGATASRRYTGTIQLERVS